MSKDTQQAVSAIVVILVLLYVVVATFGAFRVNKVEEAHVQELQ